MKRNDITKTLGLIFLIPYAFSFVGCAAANSKTADTKLNWDYSIERLDPPRPGEETVFVDFSNISGGTADLKYEIEDGVVARGYKLAQYHQEADFVLFATLRFLDAVNESNESRRVEIRKSAIAGGAAGAFTGYSTSTRRRTVIVLGDPAEAAGGVGAFVKYIKKGAQFRAIMDVQLGRGVKVDQNSASSTKSPDKSTNAAVGEMSSNSGSDGNSGKGKAYPGMKAYLEAENRIVCTTKGRRLSAEEGFKAIAEKIANELPQILPRGPLRER